MNNKIYDTIAEEVAKGTFTPAALKLMNDALDAVKQSETRIADLEKTVVKYRDSLTEWEKREKSIQDNLKSLQEREANVSKREAQVANVETRVAVAEAKESVRREVFDTMFKNVSVRRKVISNVPLMNNPGNGVASYAMNHTGSEEVTETEE